MSPGRRLWAVGSRFWGREFFFFVWWGSFKKVTYPPKKNVRLMRSFFTLDRFLKLLHGFSISIFCFKAKEGAQELEVAFLVDYGFSESGRFARRFDPCFV